MAKLSQKEFAHIVQTAPEGATEDDVMQAAARLEAATPQERKSLLTRAWEWLNAPTIDLPDIDTSHPYSKVAGMAGSLIEGMSSPMGIASTIAPVAGMAARGAGLYRASRAATAAEGALAAPYVASGAANVGQGIYEGDPVQAGVGAIEAGLGAMGVRGAQNAYQGARRESDQIVDMLRNNEPGYGIVTGANPRGEPLDDATNRAMQEMLERELRAEGLNPLPQMGVYGQREPSFLVPGMTPERAKAVGRSYDQQSVISDRGYHRGADDTTFPRTGIEFDQAAEDFYSEIDLPDGRRLKYQAQFPDEAFGPPAAVGAVDSGQANPGASPLQIRGYHGTNRDFEQFAPQNPNSVLPGFTHISTSPEYAGDLAERVREWIPNEAGSGYVPRPDRRARVIPVETSIAPEQVLDLTQPLDANTIQRMVAEGADSWEVQRLQNLLNERIDPRLSETNPQLQSEIQEQLSIVLEENPQLLKKLGIRGVRYEDNTNALGPVANFALDQDELPLRTPWGTPLSPKAGPLQGQAAASTAARVIPQEQVAQARAQTGTAQAGLPAPASLSADTTRGQAGSASEQASGLSPSFNGSTALSVAAPAAAMGVPDDPDSNWDDALRVGLMAGGAAGIGMAARTFPKRLKKDLDQFTQKMRDDYRAQGKDPGQLNSYIKTATRNRLKQLGIAKSKADVAEIEASYNTIPLPVDEVSGIDFDVRKPIVKLLKKKGSGGVQLNDWSRQRMQRAYQVGSEGGDDTWGNPRWLYHATDGDPQAAVQFARLLGAYSPGQKTQANTLNAVEAFIRSARGESPEEIMDSLMHGHPRPSTVIDNFQRAIQGGRIFAEKTEALAGAELGVHEAVPIDMWLLRALGANTDRTPPKGVYKLVAQAVADAAEQQGESPFAYMAKVWMGMQKIAGVPTPSFSESFAGLSLPGPMTRPDVQEAALQQFPKLQENAFALARGEAPQGMMFPLATNPQMPYEQFVETAQELFKAGLHGGDVLGKKKFPKTSRATTLDQLRKRDAKAREPFKH
jgi:hypothetical protein